MKTACCRYRLPPSPVGSALISSQARPGSRISARSRNRRPGSSSSRRQKVQCFTDAQVLRVTAAAARSYAADEPVH
jgi:hypothetical protein